MAEGIFLLKDEPLQILAIHWHYCDLLKEWKDFHYYVSSVKFYLFSSINSDFEYQIHPQWL